MPMTGTEFATLALTGAVSAVISGVVSVLILGSLRRYIDRKADAEDELRRSRESQRKRRIMAEAEWRQKTGRLLFWLYKGEAKPPPNGELDKAMEEFDAAEAEYKQVEREILADVYLSDG